MTSRERVRCVLEGKIPDRVPNGLGACETAGLHLCAYEKLQKAAGVRGNPPRLDTFMLNAVFERDMIEATDGDMILLASPRMCGSRLWGKGYEREWKEQSLWGRKFRVSIKEKFSVNQDGSMVWESAGGLRCPPGGFYFDSASPGAFALNYEVPSPDSYKPPKDIPEPMLRDLEETAKALYEETSLGICCGEAIEDLQIAPAGFVGSMMLMRDEPDIMHEFLQKAVDASLSQLLQLEQAIGKYVDILSVAHDLGDNRGVTMGGDLWRDIYKPHYVKWFREWKKITRMKINLHSCGSVADILSDLIECGMDIFNPVQISACGMDARAMKEQFGDKLVFYGGAYDAQTIPREADYDAVYATVKNHCGILKESGRFIFAGVHNLPGDLPEHHLSAMLKAWKDCRDY